MGMFTFNLTPQDVGYTMGGFLKTFSMLFDPLPMLAPFTIRARKAMQETWSLGLGWHHSQLEPGRLCRRRGYWV